MMLRFETSAPAMYQPPHFREDRLGVQHDLIRQHPLGLLISAGSSGLMANPIPFLIDADGSSYGTLRCHVARANLQWQDLDGLDECLVVFQGPQDYVTPSWYATKRETGKVVPTWNYATVHCWGRPRVIGDPDWLRRQIGDLTELREASRALPWAVEDAPAAFVTGQIKGIVGIEIPVARIEGKWKMSQNRSEADRQGVAEGYGEQGEAGRDMAAMVEAAGKPEAMEETAPLARPIGSAGYACIDEPCDGSCLRFGTYPAADGPFQHRGKPDPGPEILDPQIEPVRGHEDDRFR